MPDPPLSPEAAHQPDSSFKLLVEISPDAIFVRRGKEVVYANQAMVALLGCGDRSDLVGRDLLDTIVHRDDRPRVEERRRAIGAGEEAHAIRVRWIACGGRIVHVDAVTKPFVFEGVQSLLTIARDITEMVDAEQQLRQAQKMEAVGQLAGGVAHDFNNMLATVLSYADLSLLALGPDHPVAADITQIISAAQRGAALTRQLLDFSRQTPIQPKVLSLNSAVAYIEPMLRRLIGATIVVSAVLAEDLGAIKADPGHIDQILLNLAVNARDAMPDGGTLTIETRNTILDGAAAGRVGLGPGSYVVLSVADSGCGMDAATQLRIFEPFFTTKAVGKGTGLGLSTVFGIARQSGGIVTVRSQPGRGATFEVLFPRVEPVARSIPAIVAGVEPGAATLLLVEDDEPVRKAVRRLLASRGYTVLAAPGPREALDILRSEGAAVQLLVTDVVMPEMDGRTLATQVRERYPHIKVLFMSGYTEHVAVKGAALGPADHFLQKPFTFQQIVAAVKRALAPGASLHPTEDATDRAVRDKPYAARAPDASAPDRR